MIRFAEECKTIYLLARLDAGIRDEISRGHFQNVSGAFTRVQVYMEEHRDELDTVEYDELYEETMLLKAMAIAEEDNFDFDSANDLLEFAKNCDNAEIRELLKMDGIPCDDDMRSDEFAEYRKARKKRWEKGYKLTREIFSQPPSLSRK